jgi:hypothetical protein
MADVILSCPSQAAYHTQVEDIGELQRSSLATYQEKYRTQDAVFDENGDMTTPPAHSTRNYFYVRMTQTDWEALLASTNPTGIIPGQGGTFVVYAYGLTDGETWGTIPANGVQVVWA